MPANDQFIGLAEFSSPHTTAEAQPRPRMGRAPRTGSVRGGANRTTKGLDGVVTYELNLSIIQYLKEVPNPRAARGQSQFRALPSHLIVRESWGGNRSPGKPHATEGITRCHEDG
jgi:hypothetical protein